ncbi:CocE/NonD family hydrolase [Mesorhizobium sp. M2A.F.Ca.ET.043.05.1.1]|uniref:CocE/NonD family hydrolase n=1 Tax=Mesorhizobium sp. M2A.F.Ca.ET.043.05.1.1 TaxID=2493671 RepID=UPI0032B14AC3
MLDWIVKQPWSTGRVVGYGRSCPGNAADWMAERNHPGLKGIIPRAVDYDMFATCFPGGLSNVVMNYGWSNRAAERNRKTLAGDAGAPGVRLVGPGGKADLAAALRQREGVPPETEGYKQITYRDDRPSVWPDSLADFSIQDAADRVSRWGGPIQSWSSWFDSATAEGSIRRFIQVANPLSVIIGPWDHSGNNAYDPLRPAGETIPPNLKEQEANYIRFAKASLNKAGRERAKIIHYYTLGEGKWKSTRSWPIPADRRRWYMASGSRLSSSPDAPGFDSLQVDPELGDITTNRWTTTAAGGKVDYGDRRPFDAARLAYTSEPFTHDVEITGHPVVYLNVTSTREDGAFYAYLEAVRPDGVSLYLTEGQLRALHRKVWNESPFSVLGPQHSFLKRDGEPLTPGQPATLAFTMHPISALLPASYRLRVSLAGSNKTNFAMVPEDGRRPTSISIAAPPVATSICRLLSGEQPILPMKRVRSSGHARSCCV